MKPKKEDGSQDQRAEFEKSPDMVALDGLVRKVLKAPKNADNPKLEANQGSGTYNEVRI